MHCSAKSKSERLASLNLSLAPLAYLLSVLSLVLWLTGLSFTARAEGIKVDSAELQIADDTYQLNAKFDINLNPLLEDTLSKGVPLYFLVEFEVMEPRWYWFDKDIIKKQHYFKLSYHALTRQYRLGTGSLYQNFASLEEALQVLGSLHNWPVLDKNLVEKGARYQARVRMRLDVSRLPKLFQINLLNPREWNLASEWRNLLIIGNSSDPL